MKPFQQTTMKRFNTGKNRVIEKSVRVNPIRRFSTRSNRGTAPALRRILNRTNQLHAADETTAEFIGGYMPRLRRFYAMSWKHSNSIPVCRGVGQRKHDWARLALTLLLATVFT